MSIVCLKGNSDVLAFFLDVVFLLTYKERKRVETMCNEVVELPERASSTEMIDYLSGKYGVKSIITRKTLNNWCALAKVKPIDQSVRKSDIRYLRKDLLEVKYLNINKLKTKKYKNITTSERNQYIHNYYSPIEHEEDILDSGKEIELSTNQQANTMINNEMLEHCFSYLFPDTYFDQKELAQYLFLRDPNNDADQIERFEAIEYIDTKKYIKKRRPDSTDFRIIRD